MSNPDFSRQIVELIAKRAGNHCSNPDCGVLTCGPAESPTKAITIGAACHIFGARDGGRRYIAAMSDEERRDSTNGIWLCCNCHKMIDDDQLQYTAELLFGWRRWHEEQIAQRLGKPGDIIRRKILSQQLSAFEQTSALAQQIIIDKPENWEFRLTIELLRTSLAPTLARWRALDSGLYMKSTVPISQAEWNDWHRARFEELPRFIGAFSGLVERELINAWGEQGQPGNANSILAACNLIAECAQGILLWEEAIHFALVPDNFKEMHEMLRGIGGRLLYQFERLPGEIATILEQANPSGTYNIKLTIDLPPNWSQDYHAAMAKALNRLKQ